MASNYPGSLDSFTNPTENDDLDTAGVLHDEQHTNANDAIEAIQAELGADPAGLATTVKDRLDNLSADEVSVSDTGDSYDGSDVEAVLGEVAGRTSTISHGSTAATARPDVPWPVLWVGTVEPDNWLPETHGDLWFDPDDPSSTSDDGGLVAVKSADETINSDTTLGDDTDLTLAVEANKVYRFEVSVMVDGEAAADFKYGFPNIPTGATIDWLQGEPTGILRDESSTAVLNTASGSRRGERAVGTLAVGGNAGNLTLAWAQNSSDPGDTTLLANSWLWREEIA